MYIMLNVEETWRESKLFSPPREVLTKMALFFMAMKALLSNLLRVVWLRAAVQTMKSLSCRRVSKDTLSAGGRLLSASKRKCGQTNWQCVQPTYIQFLLQKK